MRLADEKSKCSSPQSKPLWEFGQCRWSERSGSDFRASPHLSSALIIIHQSILISHSQPAVSSVCMAQLGTGGASGGPLRGSVGTRNSMKNLLALALTCCLVASISSPRRSTAAAPQAGASTGSIKGRARLSGKTPGNTIIRMGLDPKCTQINQGKRLLQETVVTSADGGLANVFVRLQGSFPPAPVPAEPVIIDQRGCVYHPRVIGARVGQTLEVRNSDALHHNVHSLSAGRNSFNEEQSTVGAVGKFRLNSEEIMLRLKC